MDVVTQKTDGAPMQTPCTFHEVLAVGLYFGDVMIGMDPDRAEWPRMRIGNTFVIHGHVEEARGTEGLASGFDFFEMTAK